jgi:hypothetical protein
MQAIFPGKYIPKSSKIRHAFSVNMDFIRMARKLIVTGGTDIMAHEMKEEKWEKGGGNPAKETAVSRDA